MCRHPLSYAASAEDRERPRRGALLLGDARRARERTLNGAVHGDGSGGGDGGGARAGTRVVAQRRSLSGASRSTSQVRSDPLMSFIRTVLDRKSTRLNSSHVSESRM